MPRGMWGVLPCLPGMGIDGAHNTVNARGMWDVPSSSFGMADVGAYQTVDAQRHVGGFIVFSWYGS